MRRKFAEILPGLRAGTRPRDLLGRMQLLLLSFALVNAAGAMALVLVDPVSPFYRAAIGLAGPPVLAMVSISVYRSRRIGFVREALLLASVTAVTIGVNFPLHEDILALVSSVVFFSAAYGTLPRVVARTLLLVAIPLGQAISDASSAASITTAVVAAMGLVLVAGLMRTMAASITRYEATVRREHTLAAAGLDLVGASDMSDIADSAVEGAFALCSGLPRVRVSFALSDATDCPARTYTVLGAAGWDSDAWVTTVIPVEYLAPAGHAVADQRLLRPGGPAIGRAAADSVDAEERVVADEPDAASVAAPAFLDGEVLLTRVAVNGAARGLLIVESTHPISDELPGAIRALCTQVSLALARIDLQRDTIDRESASRFEALIQASSDVISIVGHDGLVRFQSPSLTAIFGYEPNATIGTDLAALVHPDDEARLTALFHEVAEQAGSSATCECRIRHADGSWRQAETRLTNLFDVPAVQGVVMNTRDVTERHSLEAELRHQAFHDALTGLANRALFTNRLEHALTCARRDGSTMAVLYVNMDGFERVNESLGYSAGDAALLLVAERLRMCVRGQDTVARLGGYEFGLLLERLSSPGDATQAMERVMATLNQPLQLPGAQVEVKPHIGIAISLDGDESAEDMLRNSAMAMHQAHGHEGGFAMFDPEMHADAVRRIEVESQLRTALDESQFMLYYQPTVDLQTGRLTGVEALMRWQHPRRGVVPPLEFISLAEESGLIVPMGQWAIQEACRQVRIWQREIPADEPITLAVNLSARQLRHPNLVQDVADALDDSGLLPSRLILEITESVLMIDTAATLNRLFQLKSLGVRLAVDDFGTGYSSFAYLRRFPVDILKIDKSFVDGVANEPTAGALVDAMIRIGKTLRLETVAEGIEHVDQADRLRALQCDVGQGYLFSRPLPSDAITLLLRDRAAADHANAA